MQFFDSCVWFGGLVFVSMLHSVVLDLKAVLMPYLLLLLNFPDMPGQWQLVAHLIGWAHQYFNKLINPSKILIYHRSVLSKGWSFIANSGTKAAVLPKGRSTANSETKDAVLKV